MGLKWDIDPYWKSHTYNHPLRQRDHDDFNVSLVFTYAHWDEEPRTVRMAINSEALASTSPVFKAMLSPSFQEGQTLQSTGSTEITLPDDPVAMRIALDLHFIHKPLLKYSSEQFLAICVLIDKYQMFSEDVDWNTHWSIEKLWKTGGWPKRFGKDMRHWVFVSWVLQRPDEFFESTKSVIWDSVCSIDEFDDMRHVPLAESVIKKIDEIRQSAINRLLDAVYHLLEEYQSFQCCSLECDDVVVDSLTEGLKSIGLLSRPKAPYIGFSLSVLLRGIRNINIKSHCALLNEEPYGITPCTKRSLDTLHMSLDALESEISGLHPREINGQTWGEIETSDELDGCSSDEMSC